MDRLIATNSVPFGSADLAPGSGTPQYATDGNPLTSTPATIWPAYQYNAMQDELMNVILAAGITADKANWSQLQQALAGCIANVAAVSVTTADVTLTLAQYSCAVITFSGTLTGNHNVIFPNKGRWWVVNNCSGAFSLTCKTAAGTGMIIPQGFASTIFADGTNIGPTTLAADNIEVFGNANVLGAVTIGGPPSLGQALGVGETVTFGPIVVFANSNAAPGTSTTSLINYSGSTPNNSTTHFLDCTDTGGARAQIYSNGGLANYSANNVNLSDARVKPAFERYTDDELDRLEQAFIRVDWGKFKYHDQSHDDWNHGFTAQGVEAAFADCAPELIDDWNPLTHVKIGEDKKGKPIWRADETPPEKRLKAVYETDLNNINKALLARLLVRVAKLEKRKAA